MIILKSRQKVTMDDNSKYVVIDSVVYDGQNFAYLINADNPEDQIIVLASNDDTGISVDVIDTDNETNSDLIKKLLELFIKDVVSNVSGGEKNGQ